MMSKNVVGKKGIIHFLLHLAPFLLPSTPLLFSTSMPFCSSLIIYVRQPKHINQQKFQQQPPGHPHHTSPTRQQPTLQYYNNPNLLVYKALPRVLNILYTFFDCVCCSSPPIRLCRI
ncbi:hypothetical protein QBC40DRAFT_82710 [Triangularia verruculosa]|uniref:Uncharacterized protein n=1 Tax=Triangularia verruculosa TaxID=2587418 RepID=A0AAN6XEU3_9PEZI|nr:hypothetical protein QBC40DRAFT_82710 [Triangularia verruculosa]